MRIAYPLGLLAIGNLLLLACPTSEDFRSRREEPPLFSFEEDGDRLSFWPPKTVLLVRRMDGETKVCQSELPDNGNMWTGRDVEHAFRNDDVQQSLGTTKAPYSSGTSAKLTARDATITWAVECDKCLGQSDGIKHLYSVLHTVMLNRRLLCE